MSKSNKFLIGAAVSGILSVGMASAVYADSHSKEDKEMGKCMGANKCKGKGACGEKKANSCGEKHKNGCAGKNGCGGKANECKGQGFVMTTKAKCDKMAKEKKNKDKNIHFEPNTPSTPNTSTDNGNNKSAPAAQEETDVDSNESDVNS